MAELLDETNQLLAIFTTVSKNTKKTQFIDASGLFKKETNNNVLTDKHIEQIMQVFDSKENAEHFAQSVDNDKIAENDYNLSVSSYVEAKDTREVSQLPLLNHRFRRGS